MKNKFKKFARILSITTLFLTFSCTEDLYESNKTDSHNSIKKSIITFDDIKNNQNILKEINEVTQKQQEFKMSSKLIYDSINEFYIDTDNIVLQEGNLGKSYTFSILRESKSPYVENLTVHIDNQNKSRAVLTIYNLSETEKGIASLGKAIPNILQKTLIFPINNLPSDFFSGYQNKEAPVGVSIYDLGNGVCGIIDHIENLGDEGCIIYYLEVDCPGHLSTGGSSGGSSNGGDGGYGSSSGGFTFGNNYNSNNNNNNNNNNQTTNTSGTTTGSGGGSGNYIIPYVMPADQLRKKEFMMDLKTNNLIAYNWLIQNQVSQNQILNYLEDSLNVDGLILNEYSQSDIDFVLYAINVLTVNPNANPFIGADCSSFEYAQPPGASKKGCAVTNFNHTFYTGGVFSNGSPYFGEIDSNVPIAYFTMPSGMTNGHAANLTAIAVTSAIKATDLYYADNPTITAIALGQYFKNRLTQSLSAVGGSISTSNPPFTIPSPAPYITSVLGISNPYNCN